MRNTRKFRDYHIEKLKSRKAAEVYLQVALEEFEKDGDKETFLKVLRDVAEARGGLSLLAAKIRLNRQNLYKALSPKGNPKLETIGAILHGLGFRLSVRSLAQMST